MASEASPPPPGTALDHLRYRLQLLHRRNGEPSFRVVAQRTGKAISHTTAGNVLRCDSPPGWGFLELVVEALGGSTEEFRALWIAVRDEASPLALPTPAAWEEEEDSPAPAPLLSMPDLDAAEEDLQDRATKRSRREGETRRELLLALEARADLTDRLADLHEQLGRERGRNEQLRERIASLEADRLEHGWRIERLQDELRAVRDERLHLMERLNGLHARRAELYFMWAREEESQRHEAELGRRERDAEVLALRQRLGAAEELLRSVLASRADEPSARRDGAPPSAP
ncbi:hypothetical protein [Streptomyces reniochalinae]|uniref:Uncharacterized protein n=1 Tax=Streptomyces reniochalinae TaxID=2250578 RepID=A0A367F1G8_9ACTN|nr:hypothetical protein [Streptomyces reniochalinae]RCG24214.1 hypothetical protein DQ392_03580 [Streptomyces reniochalinae]